METDPAFVTASRHSSTSTLRNSDHSRGNNWPLVPSTLTPSSAGFLLLGVPLQCSILGLIWEIIVGNEQVMSNSRAASAQNNASLFFFFGSVNSNFIICCFFHQNSKNLNLYYMYSKVSRKKQLEGCNQIGSLEYAKTIYSRIYSIKK